MNFVEILKLVPTIINLIQTIEGLFPGQGQGKAKLDAVLGLLTSAEASVEANLPQITSVVQTLVTFLNTVGVFKKAT